MVCLSFLIFWGYAFCGLEVSFWGWERVWWEGENGENEWEVRGGKGCENENKRGWMERGYEIENQGGRKFE